MINIITNITAGKFWVCYITLYSERTLFFRAWSLQQASFYAHPLDIKTYFTCIFISDNSASTDSDLLKEIALLHEIETLKSCVSLSIVPKFLYSLD